MELVEAEAVEPQALQARLAGAFELLRVGTWWGQWVKPPISGPSRCETALGGDDQLGWIRVQRLGQHLLRSAVGIGGIDELDTEAGSLEGTATCAPRLGSAGGTQKPGPDKSAGRRTRDG